MTSRAFVLSTALIALAACSKSEGERPAQVVVISEAKPERVTEQKAIEASLAEVGLVYKTNYKSYESKERLSPCDPQLVLALTSALERTEKLDEALTKDNDQDLYRDSALGLVRRVSDAKASLRKLVPGLNEYCAEDFGKQALCLEAPNKVLISINEHVANVSPLHPYLHLEEKQPLDLMVFTSDSDVRHGDDKRSAFNEIFKSMTWRNLRKIEKCLASTQSMSDLGRYVAHTAEVALQDVSSRCGELLDSNRRTGAVSGSMPMNEFCGLSR